MQPRAACTASVDAEKRSSSSGSYGAGAEGQQDDRSQQPRLMAGEGDASPSFYSAAAVGNEGRGTAGSAEGTSPGTERQG